jgi:serine/threonine-protein kinase
VPDKYPVDFGEYRLLRKLAQGGMAEIFLAQEESGRVVALKRILPHLAHQENFIRMFIDEARIVTHLDHPNVAGVYNQGKHDGFYYIAMEFVQGHSLLAVSDRAKNMRMDLPYGLLAFVVAELLAGLNCAHSARDQRGRHLGIVHRDVTPQNVLISYGGEVKLIDFGVAKARARLTQTESGFTKGKLAYMSPEQARGEELDGRSDLFSVGIILHEITTNTRLFNKEGPGGILGAIVNDPIPKPSSRVRRYPSDLERIAMKALEKDVSRRYQTADEMREDLLRFARKERPPPSRKRLKELVYDLFGPPENLGIVQEAEVQAPTPARVEAESVLRAAEDDPSSLFNRGADEAKQAPSSLEKLPADETRMMELQRSQASASAAQLEATGDSIVAHPPAQPDSIQVPVPEPRVPWRVRLGRFLKDLLLDLRVSFRERPQRWIFGGLVAALLLLGGIGVATGLPGKLWSAVTGAAAAARELKEQAGLDESARPEPQPPVLKLSSDPPGATISVDGLGVGITPERLRDLPVGSTVKLRLELEGYRPLERPVMLKPGSGEQELTLHLEPLIGGIRVVSEPAGAAVYLNGKRTRQTTPARFADLSSGEPVNVKAVKSGYRSESQVVVVPDEGFETVRFVLPIDPSAVPDGTVSVTSQPGGCRVKLDGEAVGTTPLDPVRARPGEHRVDVACDHYAEETRVVSVFSKDEAKVHVRLRPTAFGYLTIRPVPVQGSSVIVNGEPMPLPVEFVKVVPGYHRVVVKNDQLRREKTMTVEIGPDDRVVRTVQLAR